MARDEPNIPPAAARHNAPDVDSDAEAEAEAAKEIEHRDPEAPALGVIGPDDEDDAPEPNEPG